MTPPIRTTQNRHSHGAKELVGAKGLEQWLLTSTVWKMFRNQMAAQLNATEWHASCGCIL